MHNLSSLASSNDQVTNSGDNYSVTADLTISEDGAIASGETLTINNGVTLTIPSGKTLTIASGGTLTSTSGIIVNDGTIISSGTITSASDFTGSTGLVRFPTIAAYNNSNTSLTLSSNNMTSNFTLANVMSAGTIEVVLDDNLTTNGNNLTIPSGITLEIAASVTLTSTAGTIDNDGTIECSGIIATGSNFTDSSSGLVSFASVAAYDDSVASGDRLSDTLSGDRTIANYMGTGVGTTKVIMSGDDLTTDTYTLSISANVTLEVVSVRTLTIAGTITNNGTLTNNGIIYIGYGKSLPTGTLNNNNLVLYKDRTGGNGIRTSQTLNNDFTIASDEVLVIDSADVKLTISSGNTLTNNGLFIISGELSIQTGGTLHNNIGGYGDRTEVSSFPVGKITNSGTITNTGGSGGIGIRNYSIITNSGTINNTSNTGASVGILLSGSSSILTNSGIINNSSSVTDMRLQNESTLGNESSGTINNNAVNGIIVITGNSSLKNKFNGDIDNITRITKSNGGKYLQLADVDAKISSVDVTEGRTISNGEEFFSPDFENVEVDDEDEKRRLLASAVSSILSSATNNTLLLISIKALAKILPKLFKTNATKMQVVTGDLVIPTSTSKTDTAYYIPTTLDQSVKITTKGRKILVVTQTSTTTFKINKYENEAAYSGTTNPNGNSIERVSGYKETYNGFEFILGSITGRNVAGKRTRINASQPVTGFNLNSEVKMDQGSYSVSSLLSNYSQQYNFSYEDFSSSSGSSSSGYPQSSSLVSGSSSFSINSTSVLGVISTRLDINSTALSYNLILDSNQSINIEISSSSGSKLQLLNDANIIISKGSSSSTYFNSISKTHPISQIYLNIVINNTLSIREKINQVEGLINYYSTNIQVMLFIERMLGRYLVYRPIGYLPPTTIYSREIVNEEKIDDINSAKTEEATLVPVSNNIKNKMYKNYLMQSK